MGITLSIQQHRKREEKAKIDRLFEMSKMGERFKTRTFDNFIVNSENKKSLEECLELIKQNSRKYAKRQYTWFNNQMDVIWFNVDFDDFDKTINEVYNYIKNSLKRF